MTDRPAADAPSFEDLLWTATRDLVASHDPTVGDAFYRAAILHWFDPTLLAAVSASGRLRRLGRSDRAAGDADPVKLDEALRTLPFVEPYPDRGHNVHSAIRRTVLQQLGREERDFYTEVSAQADAWFSRTFDEGGSRSEDLVEAFYHRLIVDEGAAIDFGAALIDAAKQMGELSFGHGLTSALEEQVTLGNVSTASRWVARSWRADLARAALLYQEAVSIAEEIVAAPDDEVWPGLKEHAASMVAAIKGATGSYADALEWYRTAATFAEPGSEEEAEILLGMGTVEMLRNGHDEAERLFRACLRAYVPSVLALLTADEARVADPSSDPHLEQVDIPVDDGDAPAEHRYVPVTVRADDPEAWFRVEGYFTIAVGDADGDQTDLGELRGMAWPVESSRILAEVWRALASLYVQTSRLGVARRCAEMAVELATDVGDRAGSIQAVELLYLARGSATDREAVKWAITQHREAQQLAKAEGDRHAETEALLWLGNAYLDLADYRRAIAAYGKARALTDVTKNVFARAQALEGLGFAKMNAGDPETAEAMFGEALDLYHSTEHRREEGELLVRIGDMHLAMGRHDRASEAFRLALTTFEQLGIPSGRLDALSGLAQVARGERRYDDAASFLDQALDIARSIDMPRVEAGLLSDVARLETQRGHEYDADRALAAAIEVAHAAGHTQQEADLLMQKADSSQWRHRWNDAESSYTRAREVYGSLRSEAGEARALLGLLNVLEERGDYEAAIAAGRESLAIARKLREKSLEPQVMGALAVAYAEAGRHREAVRLQEAVVRRDPGDPVAVLNLGWILYLGGEHERSIEQSKLALEMDPSQTYALRNLGHANLALGRADEARDWYAKAIKERHRGEDFVVTLAVLEKLRRQQPGNAAVEEFIELFSRTQEEIDATSETKAPRLLPAR